MSDHIRIAQEIEQEAAFNEKRKIGTNLPVDTNLPEEGEVPFQSKEESPMSKANTQ